MLKAPSSVKSRLAFISVEEGLDAVLLDTTQLNLEQSVEALLKIVRARLNP